MSAEMSSAKKRKYNDDFIKYQYICTLNDNVENPQCVICLEVLSNDDKRPKRLERHLSAKLFKKRTLRFVSTKFKH